MDYAKGYEPRMQMTSKSATTITLTTMMTTSKTNSNSFWELSFCTCIQAALY